ncbi:protein LITTLE ZIPPER 1-like isoform X2 [Actinidia eriantha]|uniref:protein LITTLE ZIPPER 1-like isoform X2 n=1 Tax=Actinidia eriantha TaxID=165200 RepID=UPI002586EFFB|nr:protein LITTLE ZIPPER 1-like isoform X2 [Actinidia eriantha]
MCIGATEWIPTRTVICCTRKQRSKRSKIRVQRLNRTKRECEEKVGKDMELKNLELYKENITIMEENEKLRKKASLLHQENLALMTEFQKKFSHFDSLSAAIFLLQNSRIK